MLLFPFIKGCCYPFQSSYSNSQRISWHTHTHVYHSDVRGQQTLLQHVRHQSNSPCGMWDHVLLEFFELRFLFPMEYAFSVGVYPCFRFCRRCFVLFHHGKSRFEEDYVAFPTFANPIYQKPGKANNFLSFLHKVDSFTSLKHEFSPKKVT